MAKKQPFDSLANSDAFEELCYDLVQAEGFADVSWRGPGPDGGRDIEARWRTSDPAGGVFETRWYMECKWYEESVPFGEIEPKLLAASAARVDYLLVITSARVMNTAMNSVQEWLASRGNPFRVRYWVNRDVLVRLVRHRAVFQKHFPNLPAPGWGADEAAYYRLRILAGASVERDSWRLLPSLQWAHEKLAADPGPQVIADVANELALAGFLIRAQEALFNLPGVQPSTRIIDVRETVGFALERCQAKVVGVKFDAHLEDVRGPGSRPLLIAAVYELILNAARYGGGTARVSLTKKGLVWRLEIANEAKDEFSGEWPVVGSRGEEAKRISPSGQGIGCVVATEALGVQKLRIKWEETGPKWKVVVEGACDDEA